ncbi:L-threonylcarbamoyladenylate synthase [Flavobacteriaceae bacterium]|jgi:L-threonylcarbamoyladenylate synthase|nr:L-threonylcarbamoyladenylate synthase [Flavobacteriaceae bacterium]MDC3368907.1 L-threonylcarbamoyladenylate synthase [Flavobacteriaceae bacterium]
MIDKVLTALENKQTILYPTDTVWGIGGDATSKQVVEKIYALKQRADHKALIVLVKDIEMLSKYVQEIPEQVFAFLEEERPTTVVYPKGIQMATNLLGEDGSIGIRIPKHPFCQELLSSFDKPIISTSANVSGNETPKNFDSIDSKILEGVDYIVPLQKVTNHSQPSRVIKINVDGTVQILRA